MTNKIKVQSVIKDLGGSIITFATIVRMNSLKTKINFTKIIKR